MPSAPSQPTDPYRGWSPYQLWETVLGKACQARSDQPEEAQSLIAEFTSEGGDLPQLLQVFEGADRDKLWAIYLEKGGPDPRRASDLDVLKGLLNLFEMWFPEGNENADDPPPRRGLVPPKP